jgi:uncharacterized protein (DUF2062 family)
MKLPHESLFGSVMAGIILTLILYILVRFLVNGVFVQGIG